MFLQFKYLWTCSIARIISTERKGTDYYKGMDNNRCIEQFNVLYIIIRSVHYELHCSLSLSLSFLRSVVVQNSCVLFVEEKKNSFA